MRFVSTRLLAATVVTVFVGVGVLVASAPTSAATTAPSCLPRAVNASAQLAGTHALVSPGPGTGTADPHTQISFLGVPSGAIRSVRAVGSQSGGHSGALRPYSQGDGASFVPSKPFTAGERVTVAAQVGRQARQLQLQRRHAMVDSGRRSVPQPDAAAKRLPDLRHAAGRAGARPQRHDKRPRSGGRRHLHEQRPRSGALRTADLQPARPADLVRPTRRRSRRRRRERADLRGAAGSDLLGGPRHHARLWQR